MFLIKIVGKENVKAKVNAVQVVPWMIEIANGEIIEKMMRMAESICMIL